MLSVPNKRYPHFCQHRQSHALEILRSNADDGVPLRFQTHLLADDLWLAAKTALPCPVTDHRREIARVLVFGGEPSPKNWLDFQYRWIVVGDGLGQNDLTAVAHIERTFRSYIGGQARERVGPLLEVQEIWIRTWTAIAAIDSENPAAVWHRQRPKHQCIEQAKNRRVHADAERQSQNCDSGEPGVRPQLTQSVLQLLTNRLRGNPDRKHSLPQCEPTLSSCSDTSPATIVPARDLLAVLSARTRRTGFLAST